MDNKEIQEYKFQTFHDVAEDDPSYGAPQSYQFRDLNEVIGQDIEAKKKILRVERKRAWESDFKISPIVQEHRGLRKQEEEERERQIEQEVQARLQAIEADAVKRGYEEGVRAGREEVYNQTRLATEDKLTALSAMITDVLRTQEEIISVQKHEIYKMIKNLTKWIILRELKEDGAYVERLLEKLIVEVQTKANLLIQINQKEFEKMPEVLECVQKKIGQLPNVRVEIDYDIDEKGLVVESENGIINGTLEEQFRNLDKLFESVGVDEHE